MKKGMVLALVLGGLLLLYTATRSWSFLAMTLPEDKVILAFAALVALDGGVVIWALAFGSPNLGSAQRIIAISLTVVDFIGSAITFIADTLYTSGKFGLTFQLSTSDVTMIITIVSVIIAANVAGSVAFKMLDPDAMRKSAINDAHAQIHDESVRLLRAQIPEQAAILAPEMAASILEEEAQGIMQQVRERRARTEKLRANNGAASTPRQLPARKPQVPAQPEPMDYEEEETVEAEKVKLHKLPANPTPRPNGRHG